MRGSAAMDQQQLEKVRDGKGFIAALDQSGGSTPKALRLYGVGEDQYADETEMFDRIHKMRTRIITSPSFGGDRIVGVILFEMTMGPPDRRAGQRGLPLVGEAGRPVPEGRQGACRGSRRCPAHEADRWPGRLAR